MFGDVQLFNIVQPASVPPAVDDMKRLIVYYVLTNLSKDRSTCEGKWADDTPTIQLVQASLSPECLDGAQRLLK